MKNRRILVTAALPYINNVPHLGHIVGSHLPADIFARYCKLKGYDVLFVGGSDDNGTPAVLAAKELGVDIKTFEDKIYTEHKKIYDWFKISYDNFSRTSKPIHHKTTVDFFKEVRKNGYITEGVQESFYCPQDQRFLPDRYVKGSCPKCGYEDAYGDQCEKCGSFLETKELINPHCAICGTTPILKESKHLFLRLDKLSKKVDKWLNTKKGLWRPQVLNLAKGWIKEGLKLRCITRDIEHGVKVPIAGFEDKVFYVWFDAPIGYISITKETVPNKWESFWKDKNAEIFHFLGKDNIPFHTIFWPAMLLANGKFNLPAQVIGLQYLNYEGGKFSKSKKRGVFCENLLNSQINPDILRAYLTFLIPEMDDTEFKWNELMSRVNDDIIGNYANFINRTLSFVYNKFDKRISKPKASQITSLDKQFLQTINDLTNKIEAHLEKVQIRDAFNTILHLSKEGNRYFDHNAPWKLIKEDENRAKTVIYFCTELCKILAITTAPYLPLTAQAIWEQLNLNGIIHEKGIWDISIKLSLPKEHIINKPKILFEKITPEYIDLLKQKTTNPIDLRSLF